jgi:hypothetical protein
VKGQGRRRADANMTHEIFRPASRLTPEDIMEIAGSMA